MIRRLWVWFLAFTRADLSAVCEASVGLYGTMDYHTPEDACPVQILAARGQLWDGWWNCRRCGKSFYS